MKPTLALTIGMLMLSLLLGNSATYYYGQMLPHAGLASMALNASLVIALFVLARKVETWLQ